MRSILSPSVAALVAAVLTGGLQAVFAAPGHAGASGPLQPPAFMTAKNEAGGPSGKVVETMNAGGYTYVCLEKTGKKTWVAVPEMKVAVGSTMAFRPGMSMVNFTSKTLNRTFDSIVFSEGVTGTEAKPSSGPAPAGSAAQASPKGKAVEVEKAEGGNAYTVAEVYAKRSALDTKTVTVKGKVVKVSKKIMGKNWVHLQDGTGDQDKGTHNLVVTTQDLPGVGDVVTITGTLAKDKDFGAGYRYDVIVEGATLKK
jgi:hypothetical protein